MDGITNPEWVQAGELGIAFIALISLLIVIWYVMGANAKREDRLAKDGAAREERLLKLIEEFRPAMEAVAQKVDDLKHAQEEINGAIIKSLTDRIEALEIRLHGGENKRKTSRT